jgi:hypothetical protein
MDGKKSSQATHPLHMYVYYVKRGYELLLEWKYEYKYIFKIHTAILCYWLLIRSPLISRKRSQKIKEGKANYIVLYVNIIYGKKQSMHKIRIVVIVHYRGEFTLRQKRSPTWGVKNPVFVKRDMCVYMIDLYRERSVNRFQNWIYGASQWGPFQYLDSAYIFF